MYILPPIKEESSGYGKLVALGPVLSWGVVLREASADGSCDIVSAKREGGLARLAAFAARSALQSISVFAKRGDSVAGVRGDGEGGRDVEADPGFEPMALPSLDKSLLILGEWEAEWLELAGDTPREEV